MKPQKLTSEILDSLPKGKYAVFKNGKLIDIITVDRSSFYRVTASVGTDELFTVKEYLSYRKVKNLTIIESKFVKQPS